MDGKQIIIPISEYNELLAAKEKAKFFRAENKRLADLLYEQSKNLDSLNIEVERLKVGVANVKAEIEKYKAVDICKVSHVLQVINKYLGK